MNKKSTVWIVVGIIVVVVVAWIAVMALGRGSSSSPSPSTQSAYTAPADAFSVQFPGTPIVTNLTYTSPTAGTVPLTEYKVASTESVNAYYGVYVYHYPASYQFTSNYLPAALTSFDNTINEKYPGTTITDQTQIQFLGGSALSATIALPAGTEYALFTTKGQNAYIVSSYGVSQSEYTAFLNSFAFTQ